MANEIARAMGLSFTEMADGGEFFSKLPVDTLVCKSINCDDVSAAGVVTLICGTTSGTVIATGTTQKLAFHNATPVAQRAGAAQAAVVTTPAALTSYGYTQAQADAIVALLNEIRAVLVEKGLMKGAA